MSEDEKEEIWGEILTEELKLEEQAGQGELKRVSYGTFMKSLGGEIDYDEAEKIAGYKEPTPKQIEILLNALGNEEYLEEALEIVDNLGEGQYQPKMTKIVLGGEEKREAILSKVLKALGDYGNKEILQQLNQLKKNEKNSKLLSWYRYAFETIKGK